VSFPPGDSTWQQATGFPALRDGVVDVWRIDADDVARTSPCAEACLSRAERERASRLVTDVLRRRFIARHSALRVVLGRYLGAPAAELLFADGEHGKPALAGALAASTMRFNLSHSRRLALLAVTGSRDVGVDIECVRAGVDHQAIAERLFPDDEVRRIMEAAPDDRARLFFEQWCRHEALVKALGIGLESPIVARRDFPRASTTTWAGDRSWSVTAIPVDAGFAAALVVEGDWPALRYFAYEPPDQAGAGGR
jgi:4'-phosphopantetheinyl transferase